MAEIQAIIAAVEVALESEIPKLRVNTDSNFTIQCMTQWIKNWRRNGWKKADGKIVINKDELEVLDNLLTQNPQLEVKFNHVRGHCGIEGNEAADALAVAGSNRFVKR